MRTEWKPDIEKRVNNIVFPQLMRYGFWVEGRAKELCPVDTGNLRASIHTIGNKSENSVKVGTDKETLASKTGTAVFYAPFMEFGFTQRNGVYNPGKPFLRPALDELIQLVGGRRG